MRKRNRQKKKKTVFTLPLVLIIIAGFIGWYFTKSIEGSIYTIVLLFILFTLFKIRRKTKGSASLKKADIDEIDQMTGVEFEQYLALLFKKRGFQVSMTKASGDYGADLILKDREDVIAVQAKRYSSSVGTKAVQEVIGSMKMYGATQCWVVTNSYFTKQAEKLAHTNDVYLINRDELIEIILESK